MASITSARERVLLAAVLATAAIVYLRSLGNGFVFDDDSLIVSNPYIGQWSFIWKSLTRHIYWFIEYYPPLRYRPLLSIWLALNYHLFGLRPAGWHALMIAIHLAAVWLVFKIARRLTDSGPTALLAASLFALLPVHAEAVVWASGFGLAMGGTLVLAAFYFFTRAADDEPRKWPLAIALYALALLSHESSAAFPGLAASYVVLDPRPRTAGSGSPIERIGRAALCTMPFVLELFLYLLARRYALGFMLTDARNPPNHATLGQVMMTMPSALATDLRLLALPWRAGPAHALAVVRSPSSPEFYLPVAALLALAAAMLAVWRITPRGRLYAFCAVWILAALAPMMDLHGFVEDQFIHDAYLYVASAGSCVLLADLAIQCARIGCAARRLIWASAGALMIAYAAALWNVQRFWHDDVILFQGCIAAFPQSWHCHHDLAMTLQSHGDLEGAAAEFKRALDVEPYHGETRYMLGLVYSRLGRTSDAINEIAEAAPHMPPGPALISNLSLAQLYQAEGDLPGAERALRAALTLEPRHATALYQLAMVHQRMGRDDEAAVEMARALQMLPNPPAVAYIDLAEIYDAQGDTANRDRILKQARTAPAGDQAVGLAIARIKARHGDTQGAERLLADLTNRYPGNWEAWTAFGLLLADDHRDDAALDALARAYKLLPNDPRPHFYAARVLHSLRRDREAADQCRQALALAPAYAQARALADEIASALPADQKRSR